MDALETASVASSSGDKGEGEKTPAFSTPATGKEPLLSTHYHVRRADDTWHVGEVIQRRNTVENGFTEYYIHYKDCKSSYMYLNCIIWITLAQNFDFNSNVLTLI